MKAWVLHKPGDIRFEEIEKPQPALGEVLVKVEAAGICGSDIPRTFDTGAHMMPLIIGHEFSGTVVTQRDLESDKENIGLGQEVSGSRDWIGKRVGIFPLIPCKKCGPCLNGRYEMCRSYSYIGSRRDGAFAEYVSVPVWNLIELPDLVSFEEAAMLEPMSVAVHAMRIGIGTEQIPKMASIVVCGLGTIGLLMVQFLMDAGYKNIYVVGNKNLQKSLAVKVGISSDNFCDSRTEDVSKWLADRTDGVDLFFECVGRNDSISYAIDSAAPSGRVVLVGNPYGDITFSRNTYWKILRNQLTVLGTWNSSFAGQDSERSQHSLTDSQDLVADNTQDDWHYVLERLSTKRINPALLITHRYPLEQLDTGLHVMRDKKEEHCKVMIG
jgi:L-iditol 2-dehydrogenase